VVLALCEVGRYLFSDNLATFLNYLVSSRALGDNSKNGKILSDFITTTLLVIANLIIWTPISREFKQTSLYRRW